MADKREAPTKPRKWQLQLTPIQKQSFLSLLKIGQDAGIFTKDTIERLNRSTKSRTMWNKFVGDTVELVQHPECLNIASGSLRKQILFDSEEFLRVLGVPFSTYDQAWSTNGKHQPSYVKRSLQPSRKKPSKNADQVAQRRQSTDEQLPSESQVREHQQRHTCQAAGDLRQRQDEASKQRRRHSGGYSLMQDSCNISAKEIAIYMKSATKEDLGRYIETVRRTNVLKSYQPDCIEVLVEPRLHAQQHTEVPQYEKTKYIDPSLIIKKNHILRIEQICPQLNRCTLGSAGH